MRYRVIPICMVRGFAKRVFSLTIFIAFCNLSFTQQYKLLKTIPLYEIPGLRNIVNATQIIQDRLGFIWLGTLNGLYKFDGYHVTQYLFDPHQPEKLAGNWITGLTEDDAGNVWIGIFGIGLQKLDPLTGKFTLYKADPANPDALVNDRINTLLFHNGKLWIGTQGGLVVFLLKKGNLELI